MKIAFVNQPIDKILPPYQSSIGACTYGVATALAKDADVTVYGLHDHHDEFGIEYRENGVRFRFLPASARDRVVAKLWPKFAGLGRTRAPISTSSWFYPDFMKRVAEELSLGAFDAIHVQHSSQYLPVIRRLNPHPKLILHLHAEWFSQSDFSLLEQRLQAADLVTAVGDHIAAKTRAQFPAMAARCATTYNGIDAAEFARPPVSKEGRAQKCILYAGGISPHKGVHVLLEAFRTIAERHPDVVLDIAGPQGIYPLDEVFDRGDRTGREMVAPYYAGGDYVAQLKGLIPPSLSSKVRFLGMIPRGELVERYYNADIFAFAPVWNEGFGIPPVEAMAAGVPVVGTRAGALVETVKHGETGLLVERNDAAALAGAALTLLENGHLRCALGAAGRARVMKQFTWQSVAGGLLQRYEELCCRNLRAHANTAAPVRESRNIPAHTV